jgi:hypothetical protein
MFADTHADMHEEHRLWQNETAMWHDDLGLWRGVYRKALADLFALESALTKHLLALDHHEQNVQQHERHLTEHERLLAAFKQGKPVDELRLLATAKSHQEERRKHACQREYHERVKKEHHAALAHWSPLLREIARSASSSPA